MRILKIVQGYYPFQECGGPVVKVRSLACGLANLGHSVTILTADLGLDRFRSRHSEFEPCRWGWRFQEGGVEAIYLPTLARHRALTVNPDVIRFCRSSLGDFDVAHFYGLYDLLGPAVARACRRQSMPYVIEPMGMFRPIDRSFRMKRLWHAILGRAFFLGAARLVATSDLEREELVGGAPSEKLCVRYNGVDSNLRALRSARGAFRRQWNLPSEEPLILFLSRLIPRKRADTLIETFAKVCPQSGRLVIAGPEGEPGYRAYLHRYAQEAGVGDRVLFPGPLYEQDKRAALADSDLFVLPSLYENFANVAAEAVACGVPVIVTDRCGIHSLIDGRAGLVVPPQHEALAEALRKVLSDEALYRKLKAGCQQVAEELDWEMLSRQMESLYREIVKAGDLRSAEMLHTLVSS